MSTMMMRMNYGPSRIEEELSDYYEECESDGEDGPTNQPSYSLLSQPSPSHPPPSTQPAPTASDSMEHSQSTSSQPTSEVQQPEVPPPTPVSRGSDQVTAVPATTQSTATHSLTRKQRNPFRSANLDTTAGSKPEASGISSQQGSSAENREARRGRRSERKDK